MRRAAVALLVAAACSSPKMRAPGGDDPTAAVVDDAHVIVKTGPVGATKPADATYVLADVSNRSTVDRLVTVGGALVDEGGKEVGTVAADELRIPAGGVRTYALVASKPVPEARGAKLKVVNAVAVDYPPQILLGDEKTTHANLTVATAVAKNTIDKDATCVVAATFYGADGAILSRPFTVVSLPPGGTQQLRFEGPREATKAVVYVGQVAFH